MLHRNLQQLVRLILAGAAFSSADTALATSGDLDPAFATGGKLNLDFAVSASMPDYAEATAMAADGSGNIYVSGFAAPTGNDQVTLVKLSSTGTLVAGFGSAGKALLPNVYGSIFPSSLTLGSNGNLYVYGSATNYPNFGGAAVEVSSTGHPVTTFGSGGTSFIALNGSFTSSVGVAVNASGEVYLAGSEKSTTLDFYVIKLDVHGAVISSFGTAGTALIDFNGGADYAGAIALDGSGNVIIAGETDDAVTGDSDFAFAKLDSSGHLIPTFGVGGKAQVHVASRDTGVVSVALDKAGNIYGAGFGNASGFSPAFAVTKLDASGHSVSTFASNGSKLMNAEGISGVVNGISLDSFGNIFVGGGVGAFRVVELDSSGNYVQAFGANGLVTFCFSCGHDYANAMILDGDSHLYMAGYTDISPGTGEQFSVAKLAISVPNLIFADGFNPTP